MSHYEGSDPSGQRLKEAAGHTRIYTIYEVIYPDPWRRASGESADEAVSRAFFGSPGEARTFWAHNGGEIREQQVSLSRLRLMQAHGLIR